MPNYRAFSHQCLVVVPAAASASVRCFLTRFASKKPNTLVVAVVARAPKLDLPNVDFVEYEVNGAHNDVLDLAAFRLREVFIYTSKKDDESKLDSAILHEIFYHDIDRICCIDYELNSWDYAAYENKVAHILSIFPGPMVPLNMGSHQRAFNLVSHLNRTGHYCDALITSGQPAHFPRLQRVLRAVAPRVHTYENTKGKRPLVYQAAQGLERAWFTLRNQRSAEPDGFIDRALDKPTPSAKRVLKALLDEGRYRTVIVNYAWMIDIDELVREQSDIEWLCDTHDVQFVRSKHSGPRRPFHSNSREKKAELDRLRRMDHLIAISREDQAILAEALPDKRVIVAPAGFDYARLKVSRRNPAVPLRFGFIGGRMEANLKAVKIIVDEWWPEIARLSPDSKLYLAGTICQMEEVKELIFLDPSIVALGYIESLKAYYSGIDVVLSPVAIRGGLNFKSVEALMAGKTLVTNSLGARCLGSPTCCRIVNSPGQLAQVITAIECDPDGDLEFRRRAQKFATNFFGERTCYDELTAVLARPGHAAGTMEAAA